MKTRHVHMVQLLRQQGPTTPPHPTPSHPKLRISFDKGILHGAIELNLLGKKETDRVVLDTRSLDIKSVMVDGVPGDFQLGTKGVLA